MKITLITVITNVDQDYVDGFISKAVPVDLRTELKTKRVAIRSSKSDGPNGISTTNTFYRILEDDEDIGKKVGTLPDVEIDEWKIKILAAADAQAKDETLWCTEDISIGEAYLQQSLRWLHRVIENSNPIALIKIIKQSEDYL